MHPSAGTPFKIIELLALYPNLLLLEPFGLINFHSTETYLRIIQSNLEFINANIQLLIKGKTWFKNTKTFVNNILKLMINSNAVFKCFYEYYLPQIEKNQKIWKIENFL